MPKVNLHTCWPVGPQCETADDIPMTLYSLPASIAVYHGTDGLGSAATDWINVGLEIEDSPGEGGFCEYVTGVGSIVAGVSLYAKFPHLSLIASYFVHLRLLQQLICYSPVRKLKAKQQEGYLN